MHWLETFKRRGRERESRIALALLFSGNILELQSPTSRSKISHFSILIQVRKIIIKRKSALEPFRDFIDRRVALPRVQSSSIRKWLLVTSSHL